MNKAEPTNDKTKASQPWAKRVHSLAGTWAKEIPTLEEVCAAEEQDFLQASF
jgi:hypothetical protein